MKVNLLLAVVFEAHLFRLEWKGVGKLYTKDSIFVILSDLMALAKSLSFSMSKGLLLVPPTHFFIQYIFVSMLVLIKTMETKVSSLANRIMRA